MQQKNLYISLDMEADGPIPGTNSMRSLGAVAYTENGLDVGRFSENLLPLSNATENPATMKWWKDFPDAWAKTCEDPQDPADVMQRFAAWLHELERTYNVQCVMVAYPVSFDYDFVLFYARMFLGRDPFRGQIIDVRSMAMGLLGTSFGASAKGKMPLRWFLGVSLHTHVAVEDAQSQGEIFVNMLLESQKRGIYGWLWRRWRDWQARPLKHHV